MAAPRSTLYRLADDKLGGRLAERLAEMRADDRSWRWIARKLEPELGFCPSYETVRSWAIALAADEPEAASA